jgi:outer membrane protein TolC
MNAPCPQRSLRSRSPAACRGPLPSSVAAACLLLVAGCTVGPDYQRPDAAVSDAWQAGVRSEPAENVRWWEQFNDPVLTSLVHEACSQNLTLRQAGLRVLEAPPIIAAGVPADLLRRRPDIGTAERAAAAQSARIGQAVADLYPQISITGSTGFVSSNLQGSRSPDLGNIFDADSFAGFVGLQVNWPVLN